MVEEEKITFGTNCGHGKRWATLYMLVRSLSYAARMRWQAQIYTYTHAHIQFPTILEMYWHQKLKTLKCLSAIVRTSWLYSCEYTKLHSKKEQEEEVEKTKNNNKRYK